jgi:hypothetical protein
MPATTEKHENSRPNKVTILIINESSTKGVGTLHFMEEGIDAEISEAWPGSGEVMKIGR